MPKPWIIFLLLKATGSEPPASRYIRNSTWHWEETKGAAGEDEVPALCLDDLQDPPPPFFGGTTVKRTMPREFVRTVFILTP
jgi:hypothetical protein